MNKIKATILDPFYFKIIATLIFVVSTTQYTGFIYDYGIYAIVIWGSGVFWINTFLNKTRLKKIDYLIYIFILGYFITIVTNLDDSVPVQLFVLLCCCMYFYSFFSADDIQKYERDNYVIMFIIVIITFIFVLISYGLFIYDMTTGVNNTYNIHGDTNIQFIGIYKGVSTQAVLSGISMLSSLGLIVVAIKQPIRYKRIFIIFNIVNFVLQDLAVTISYTTAGMIAVTISLMIGLFLIFIDKNKKKNVVITLSFLLIAIILSVSNYMVMNYVGSNFIDTFASVSKTSSELQADDAISGVSNSNGRMVIWESGIEQWKENLVFGNGYGDFYVKVNLNETKYIEYRNVHSGYLELLNSCGLWGFVSIIVFGAFYIGRFFIIILRDKNRYKYIGVAMIIIHSCLYAAINQLFILDRDISVFLLCTFLGLARINCKQEDNLL